MQEEVKRQEELKKVIANSEQAIANEELSDEQLEAVAGGRCFRNTTAFTTVCLALTSCHNANDLV